MKQPKVLILYTGGTFGMDLKQGKKDAPPELSIPHLSPKILKARFLKQVPELRKIAQCDVKILFNRDSAHIGPEEWVILAQAIANSWKSYDGFVILHGTDTMAYTASALSFLLRPCLKPVVLTGAQRPLSAIRTDARNNLISAVEIAARGPREIVQQVSVFFDNHLYQGNRVRKVSASDFAAFESPQMQPLATVGTSIRYLHELSSPLMIKGSAQPVLKPQFSKRVLLLQITPAFPAQSLTTEFLGQFDALVLVIFLSGTAPTHDPALRAFLDRARRMQIPLIITTEGSSLPPNLIASPQYTAAAYAAGSELVSTGCYWAGAMTPECAFVKASLLIAQPQGKRKFSKLWQHDLAHEA